MVTRTLPPMTSDESHSVASSVVSACEQVGEMRRIRSHVTADGEHSYCEFDALSADACRQHASLAGLPLDDVTPLGLEMGPSWAARGPDAMR